jgi:hypothetical protein
MAKVQILAHISGTRNGVDWPEPGQILDVPQDEADQLISQRLARVPEKPERGSKPEPEKATARKPETRKGLTTKDV